MGKAKGIMNYEKLVGFDKEDDFDWAIIRPEFVAVFKKDADHGNKSAIEQGVVEAVTFQGTRLSMQIRIGEHILEAEQPIEANMFTVGERSGCTHLSTVFVQQYGRSYCQEQSARTGPSVLYLVIFSR